MPEAKRTVAVLTALPLEYDAIREHLTDIETLTHPRYGTKAKLGQLPDSPWQVVLINMGEGTLTAATLTDRVLTWLDPEAVLLVGVAGGVKDDIGIGDVVETVYQALYFQARGGLKREVQAAIRSGRTRRRPRRDPQRRTPRFIDPMVMLSDRPADIEDRAVPGH
ncbi:hypothetical protein GCM10020295_70640 [Streptomyces cinereospinus]